MVCEYYALIDKVKPAILLNYVVDKVIDMEDFKMWRVTLRLIPTGICGVLVILLTLSFHLSVWATDFTANISREMLNQKLSGEILVSKDRYRMTLHPQGMNEENNLIVIVDRQNHKTIVLPPHTTTYQEIENFSISAFLVDPFQTLEVLGNTVEKKKIGTEMIAGYACDHYGFYDQDFKLADVWFAPDLDNFPVKAHIVSGRDDGAIQVKSNIGDTKLELSDISEEPIEAALFSVPRGYAKAEAPAKVRKKTAGSLQTVAEVVKGEAPWGRRIGAGGELQVKVDPQRPVKIVFYNRNDTASSCTYTTFRLGDTQTPVKTGHISMTKKGQKREVTIKKNKQTEWVFIRVDEGMIYANLVNERDPFSFDRYKLQDGYLTAKGWQSMGMVVTPARKLIVTITGDCQESPSSEVSLLCFQQDYADKVFEEKIQIANRETKTWEFLPDQQIKTCEIKIGKTGGVKYKLVQPPLVK